MTQAEITYLLPYLASSLLVLVVLFFAFGKRKAKGAPVLCFYLAGLAIWSWGFLFELVSVDLPMKLSWDKFQWLGIQIVLVAIPAFAIQFTEYNLRHYKRWFAASLIVPIIFIILVVTDDSHHLIYQNIRLVAGVPFSELKYSITPTTILYAIYGYAVVLWGLSILARLTLRPHSLYFGQLLTVILGFILICAGTLTTLFDIYIIPQRDPISLTSALSSLIIAWGIFRYRSFDVAPIGREKVFESLVDPVVLLDAKSRVIDINTSMLTMLDKNSNQVIGEPAKKVFDNFPIPIKMYTQVSYARAEFSFAMNNRNVHYELTVWPLYDSNRKMLGRIYISHDITAMKELEGELRKLNSELEDRVETRTRELAEAYEQMLEGLARALELRDKETEGHSRRVTEMALKIALKTGLAGNALEDIRSGAILHDIGKISIPDDILHKQGPLTPEERAVINQHPETAYKLLSPIPFLNKAIEIPYSHHEKWDGTGYPRGLAGRDIPASARIFAIADVWDALSYDRPYNKAWSREKIIDYFKEQSGKHFDPNIVRIFLSMVEKGEI